MELTVQGKQIDVGNALREHVTGKIEDITTKYFNHATGATVTFSKEGHGKSQTKVHIAIQVGKNILINTDCLANDPYGAFDTAAEKAGKRLRRYKKSYVITTTAMRKILLRRVKRRAITFWPHSRIRITKRKTIMCLKAMTQS